MDKKILGFISFFSYTGFYVGLVLLLSLNLSTLTRFYSIPIRLVITLLSFIFVFYYSNKGKKATWNNANFIYLFWIIYLIKTYLDILEPVTFYSKTPIEFFLYTIIYCIIPFLLFKSVDLKKYSNLIIDSFIFAGFILGVVTIYLYKDIILSGNIGRINQAAYLGFDITTINPLILSYTSSLTLGFVFFKLGDNVKKSKTKIIYYLLTIIVSLVLLLIGASRGAVIALVLSLFFLILFGTNKFKKRLLLLLILISPVLFYGIFYIGSSLVGRLSSIENLEGDNSASLRIEYWSDAFLEFNNNPLFGGKLELNDIYPHNIFIEVLMTTGAIGFICFLIFVFYCIKKIFVVSKSQPQYIWVSMFFIQALIHYNFTESIYLANALFISAGLICSPYFKKYKNEIN